jgi:hypothetical protein
VAGARVDRLGLAAVALEGPRVQQGAGAGQPGGGVRVEHRHGARADLDVAGLGVGCGRGDRVAGGPGGVPAVEHGHLGVAGPAQQPPGARRDRAVVGVVGDHGPVGPDAGGAQHTLEIGRVGQRVAATGAGRGGEIGVQVEVHRAGQVAGVVLVAARRAAQPPAHVQQGGRSRAGEQGGQIRSGHQGAGQFGHVPILPGLSG